MKRANWLFLLFMTMTMVVGAAACDCSGGSSHSHALNVIDDDNKPFRSPMNGGTTADLLGVWGGAASDVFALGINSSNAGVIIHYDGSWSSAMTPPTRQLYGGWGSSASDDFEVEDIPLPAIHAAIPHYDGSVWSDMDVPTGALGLSGVWGTSRSDVFAVGDRGTILHYGP